MAEEVIDDRQTTVSIGIQPSLLARVDALSDIERVPRSKWVRQAIKERLSREEGRR